MLSCINGFLSIDIANIYIFCNQCSNNENFISSKKNVEFSNIMPTSEEIAIFKEDIVYIFLI